MNLRPQRSSPGISMVEILVTLAILGLAIAPLFGLMDISARRTQTSMSFFLATQYADEIAQQLFRLSTLLPQMVGELAAAGGSSSPPGLAAMLMDKKFNEEFQKSDGFFRMVPFQYQGKETKAFLVLSPLERHFLDRYLVAEELNPAGVKHLGGTKLVKVYIHLKWQDSPTSKVQEAAFPIILKSS